METDIALMASGYVLTRFAIMAAIGYALYRAVCMEMRKTGTKSTSRYAVERAKVTRSQR